MNETDFNRVAFGAGIAEGEDAFVYLRRLLVDGKGWFSEVDERQGKEIGLARVYAQEFAHGTSGHNQLINLLADLLDAYQEIIERLGEAA
jgi:hypothetical protein